MGILSNFVGLFYYFSITTSELIALYLSCLGGRAIGNSLDTIGAGSRRVAFAWCGAIIFLFLSGVLYRGAYSKYGRGELSEFKLQVGLSEFPYRIGGWVGGDVSMDRSVLKAAANDDYLLREYEHEDSREKVNVYVGYSSRPRTMVGHRPEICYVNSGWVSDTRKSLNVRSGNQVEMSCVVHSFYRPSPKVGEVVVLNFYIVNGRVTMDESVFSGIGWRTPNVDGTAARYVAQVQISSSRESAVLKAAKDMGEMIVMFFPVKGDGAALSEEKAETAGEN